MKVSVYEAKSKLSQMINKALDGEEVVITRNGKDTVMLVPATNGKKTSWIGSMKGQISMRPGLDDPLDDDDPMKYLTGERDAPFPE